jgi:probable phosphoglycerate mutase
LILLARHGQTDHNVPPARVMGRLDMPLNERGRGQAEALAREVAQNGIAAVWASPLSRARETAEIVGRTVGIEPRLDERLAESDRGEWEGRLLRDIEREDPAGWRAWRLAGASFRFPGGESLAEHMERVSAALDEVAAGPLPALVVCHGGTIRCAFAARHERGLDAFHELEVPNGALLQLDAGLE